MSGKLRRVGINMEFFIIWLIASVVFLLYGAYHCRKKMVRTLKFNFKWWTVTAAITVITFGAFLFLENKQEAVDMSFGVLSISLVLWGIMAALWCVWFIFLSIEWVLRFFCYPFHIIRAKRLGDTPNSFGVYVYDMENMTKEEIERFEAWWNGMSNKEKEEYLAERERQFQAHVAEVEAREYERQAKQQAKQAKRQSYYGNLNTGGSTSQPSRQPTKPTSYTSKPHKPKQYFVERMGPGQQKYQKVTGGNSNYATAERRKEQAMDAHYGTDRTYGASNAKYRIVDEDGKVQ